MSVGSLFWCFFALSQSAIIFHSPSFIVHRNVMEEKSAKVDHAVILGVGTAMRCENYSKIASVIASYLRNSLVIIFDNNPGDIRKFSPKSYANGFEKIIHWIKCEYPGCLSSRINIYIGGHSASCQAAIQAKLSVDGLIGLDPCCVDDEVPFPPFTPKLPNTTASSQLFTMKTLFWATSSDQCGVSSHNGGGGFFQLSARNQNKRSKTLFRFIGSEQHCIFTNHGCLFPFCCMGVSPAVQEAAFESVAKSIATFLSDAKQIALPGASMVCTSAS